MADLGQKHECPECGLKFYDLGKSDALCPKCGDGSESAGEEPKAKAKAKAKAKPKKKKKNAKG